MGTASWLTTWLDYQLLTDRGVMIYPPLGSGPEPPVRTGTEVAAELGGRKLLRYLLPHQVSEFREGTTRQTYTTPTPYTPEETVSWLVLPDVTGPRPYALILDPALIPAIQGPLWVAAGRGIQYILVSGFPQQAIIAPGAPGATWEVVVS